MQLLKRTQFIYRVYNFKLVHKSISHSLAEPNVPKIESSDATVSWYNREPRVLPVGGTVEVLSGTEVTLTCKYSAFPEPDVKWTVLDEEGDPLPDAGYEVINGSLVLRALQPSDSAQYVCSVKNVAGTASASTVLKVVGKYFSFLFFPSSSFFIAQSYLPCSFKNRIAKVKTLASDSNITKKISLHCMQGLMYARELKTFLCL